MKKLCILALLFLSFSSNAQKENTTPSALICSSEDRSKWFVITPHFKEYDGTFKKDYLTTIKTNIGRFSNRDILKFTFIDKKYMSIKSTNGLSFNGEELSFPLNPVQAGVLEMKSIKSIEYINGNDKSNFIYKLTKDEGNYFINILKK